MRRWSIGAFSPTSRRSVAKWFQSVCQSFGDGFINVTDLSAHDSVISQQVLEEVRSTIKNGKKRPSCCPRTHPVLASLLLINRLYTILATIAAFWFTFCRRSNCNCPVVNILKTCKEMVRLWNVSFLYAFVLIENRSTVSHRPVTAQLQPVTDHSPTIRRQVSTDRKLIAVRTVNSCR